MTSYHPMVKNSAQRIVFPILDADGDPVTGAASDSPDSEYSLDGGSFSDCNDEIHEIATTSGVYYLDLQSGETNGDVVCIQVKTATSTTKTTVLVFYTSAQSLDTVDTNIDTLLTRVPSALSLTGGNVHAHIKATDDIDLSATQKASVNTEVDNALNTAIPGSPTADSVNERLVTIDDAYTATRGGYLDNLNNANLATIPDISTLSAARIGYLDELDFDLNARLGSPVGASISVDIAALQTDLDNPSQYQATGFSTHSAADVWAAAGRELSTPNNYKADVSNLDAAVSTRSSHAAADIWSVGTRALTDKADFALSAAGIDSIIDEVIEGSVTFRQAVRLILSFQMGKCSGGGTTTLTFRDIGDSKDRLVYTVDANGNRSAVTRNGS